MEEKKSSPSDPIRAANTTNNAFPVFFQLFSFSINLGPLVSMIPPYL